MIRPEILLEEFKKNDVNFFTGVPDSLLKEFGHTLVSGHLVEHVISANEGTAVGIGIGYHLATAGIPVVYMQNSGIGNSLNPLISLADKRVFSIPIVLLIGWRGEPGIRDEPQHLSQGISTVPILEAAGIAWSRLGASREEARTSISWAVRTARETSAPVALLVSAGVFEKSSTPLSSGGGDLTVATELTREHAIDLIISQLSQNELVVSSTGMISRELNEVVARANYRDLPRIFMTIGGMGHASQIALGYAISKDERVICLDGDGAALMHMGGMATIGTSSAHGLIHVVLNNGVHDSVGGQPTAATTISLSDAARACGYPNVLRNARSEDELLSSMRDALSTKGPTFLEISVLPGHRAGLSRPSSSPIEVKHSFMLGDGD